MSDQNASGGRPPSVAQALSGLPLSIWILLAGMLVNRLGNFLQIYLVLYLTHEGFSASRAALALGAYGVGSVLGVLFGGTAGDRFGHGRTIAVSMALSGLLVLGIVTLHNLPAVVVLAAVIGMTAQAYRPASSALLVERTPADHHVMVFAVYRMAFNLGTTCGPLLGALLISRSYHLMFYIDAVTSLLFAVLAAVTVRGDREHPTEQPAERPADTGSRSYAAVLRDRPYVLFMLALFLNAVVYIQHTSALPLQLRQDGHGTTVYAALLSLNAAVVICLELLATSYVQKLPGRLAVALGVGLVGVGMNMYAIGSAVALYVVATLVWTAGEMIGTPTASAYPGQVAPPALRGRYIAAAAVPMQIGYAVGPVLGVAVWQWSPAGVWWLCGLLTVLAVGAVLAGMTGPRRPEREPAPAADRPGPAAGLPGQEDPATA